MSIPVSTFTLCYVLLQCFVRTAAQALVILSLLLSHGLEKSVLPHSPCWAVPTPQVSITDMAEHLVFVVLYHIGGQAEA